MPDERRYIDMEDLWTDGYLRTASEIDKHARQGVFLATPNPDQLRADLDRVVELAQWAVGMEPRNRLDAIKVERVRAAALRGAT